MKYSVFFAVLFTVVVVVYCRSSIRPEYCDEQTIAEAPKGKCLTLICSEDNSYVDVLYCVIPECPDGFTLVKYEENLTKPSPYCCPRITCKNGEETIRLPY